MILFRARSQRNDHWVILGTQGTPCEPNWDNIVFIMFHVPEHQVSSDPVSNLLGNISILPSS